MDRRTFLKSAGVLTGVLGTGGLLSACGGDAGGIPGGDPSLNVINASLEMLTGDAQRLAVAVTTFDNEPVKGAPIELYLRTIEEEMESGPYPTSFYDEGGIGLGVYLAHLDVPEPGTFEVVAVHGDDFGTAFVNVVRPEDSQVQVPGDPAVSTRTPTVDDPMDAAELCTRNPDCGMHEHSLDEALTTGRPIVLMFATPAYCRTAVCGPAVDTLEEIRTSRDWGDVQFIHCEIFKDAGVTLLEPIEDWGLPTEPWLFLIDGDGNLATRLDGPMISTEIRQLIEQLA